MGFTRSKEKVGGYRVHMVCLCALFVLLSLSYAVPSYAAENARQDTITTGVTDGCNGLDVASLLGLTEAQEEMIAQMNDMNDLEGFLGDTLYSRNDEIMIDGVMVTMGDNNLPSKMEFEDGKEVSYRYKYEKEGEDSAVSDDEIQADGAELKDISEIRITSRTASGTMVRVTLEGEDARQAAAELHMFVMAGSIESDNDPSPPVGKKPSKPTDGDGEGYARPHVLQLGRAVAEIAELLEEDLQKELGQSGAESKDISNQEAKPVVRSNSLQVQAELESKGLGRSRRKRYNEFYNSKLKPLLKNLGLSDYEVRTDGSFRTLLITPPRNR